jgi:hypothetical protein
MKKPEVVDNTQIRNFYDGCQEIVSRWNKQRPDNGGELVVTLELHRKGSDRLVIRIDPHPPGTGQAPRMTILLIWYNPDMLIFESTTPGLPLDLTDPITLEQLHATLQRFNP